MSGNVTITVEGLRELEKALVELSDKAPAMIAKAQREPMQKVLEDARSLVPKRTGALYDALQLTPVRRASAMRASMADTLSEVGLRLVNPKAGVVGTGGGRTNMRPRSYWHLVEFGTAHSAARPFIIPAFDRNTDHLIGRFKAILAGEIERYRARHARRRRRW